MHYLTINTETCNGPDNCEACICENILPKIQEYLKKRGHFKISNSYYKRKKPLIDQLIKSCPTGSISESKPA